MTKTKKQKENKRAKEEKNFLLAKAGDMREARASTSACLARFELHGSVLKGWS